jgi:hypothetical protein
MLRSSSVTKFKSAVQLDDRSEAVTVHVEPRLNECSVKLTVSNLAAQRDSSFILFIFFFFLKIARSTE